MSSSQSFEALSGAPPSKAFQSRKSFYESTKKGICVYKRCAHAINLKLIFFVFFFLFVCLLASLFAFFIRPSTVEVYCFYTLWAKIAFDERIHTRYICSTLTVKGALINTLNEPDDVVRLKVSTLSDNSGSLELEGINCVFPSLT
jgi:hypothetical protein